MSRVCETFVILLLLAICMAVLTQLGISFWSRQSPFTLLGRVCWFGGLVVVVLIVCVCYCG